MQEVSRLIEFNKLAMTETDELLNSYFEQFNINFFIYRSFFYDGRVVYVTNNDNWLAHRVEYLPWVSFTLFKEYEMVLKNQFLCFPWVGNPDKADIVYQHLFDFDIWNGISIYEPFKDGINIWGFASSRSYNNIELYLNKIELFSHWIITFKATKTYQNRFLYTPKNNLSDLELEKLKKLSFHPQEYTEAHKKKDVSVCITLGEKEIKITHREFQCLLLLSKGLSAKGISNSLNISPRTVEYYINNIKIKSGNNFSSYLVKSFIENSFNTLL